MRISAFFVRLCPLKNYGMMGHNIKSKDVKPVSKRLKKSIYIRVKGLLFHKIGGFIVLGSDNIIISMTKTKIYLNLLSPIKEKDYSKSILKKEKHMVI